MSNSAYFGCSRKVGSIEDVVSLIGLRKLKTLVVASGVTSAFTEVPSINLKRFWQHSLITVSIARQFATDANLDPDAAYIAGLMHSVGQLPIHLVFPAAGKQIDETCQGKSVLERNKVEQAILGIDHNHVGSKLAKQWNFPDSIVQAIQYYTDPLNKNASDIATVVYIAARIAFDLEA